VVFFLTPPSDLAKARANWSPEREEKLRMLLRACRSNFFLAVTSDDKEVMEIVWDTLTLRVNTIKSFEASADKTIFLWETQQGGKKDIGELFPTATREVAHQRPKAWFSVNVYLSVDEQSLSLADIRARLGEEDSTGKDFFPRLTQFGSQHLPVTWHFYGWCGFGENAEGKVVYLKANCRALPKDPRFRW